MGVAHGIDFGGYLSDFNTWDPSRSAHRPLHEVAGSLPQDTINTLRAHFDSMSEPKKLEHCMDIKAVLKALEGAGIQLTTQNLVPLIGQLTELGMAAAEKGISDLSHKAGVKDVTQQGQ